MENFKIVTTEEITPGQVKDLLITAFEGGSNYWLASAEPLKRTSKAKEISDRFYEDALEHGFQITQSNAYSAHGKLVPSESGLTCNVVPGDFQQALEIMQKKYAHFFKDITTDNVDAYTADVFLQLAAFRGVIYG